MPFLVRAHTIYDRGNTVAAAIALVEGLKRHPDNVEAFRWLLDLYCEEVPHTGLEEDLVQVFDACPDPEGVYHFVFQRLLKGGRERFISRLDRARREVAARQGRYVAPWDEIAQHQRSEPVEEVIEAPEPIPQPQQQQVPEQAYAYSASQSVMTARAQVQGSPFAQQPRAPQPMPPRFRPPAAQPAARPVSQRRAQSPPANRPARREPMKVWEGIVHPALLDREEARDSAPGFEPYTPPSYPPERPVKRAAPKAAPAPRAEARGEVMDLDAVRALEDGPITRDGSWRTGSKPRAKTRTSPPKKRKWVLAVAVVVGLFLAVLAVTRLVTVAERRHAVQGAAMALESFQPSLQQDAEAVLAEAVAADPESVELSGRLRWTRSLQRHITSNAAGVALPQAEPKEAPDGEVTAWFVAADVVEALVAGRQQAAAALLGTLDDAPGAEGFPAPIAAWIDAEVRIANGDLKPALEIHEQGARAGFVPSMIGVLDVHMRRGDVLAARRALDLLRKAAPEHPAVALGDAALIQLHQLIKDPRSAKLQTPDSLTTAELNDAAMDKRLTPWVVLASPDYARKRGIAPDISTHPVLKLVYARQMLTEGKVNDIQGAFEVLEGSVSSDLQDAGATILTGGYARAGRPDLALKHVPAPEQKGEVGAEIFVKKNPSAALTRAALLADAGRYDESRSFLMRLINHSRMSAEARVVALQLHLTEGRTEDVERHIERLKDHRGALVAGAALDLYRNRPESAAAKLGPVSPGSLPDTEAAPHLRRFEIRVRLLTLKALGHHEQVSALLQGVKVSPALEARVLGPEKGSTLRSRVVKTAPTRIEDLLDLAMASLEAGDVEKARDSARQIIKIVPSHTEAHRIEGRALLGEGRGKLAAQHLEAATRGRGDQPDMTLAMAEAMYHSGQKIRAIHALRSHLDKNPNDAKALALLGEAYVNTRRLTMGREDLQGRFKRLSPKRDKVAAGEAALQLARLHGAGKGHEKGGVWLRQARRLLGERPDVMLTDADFTAKRGDKQRAMVLYQRVSELPGAPNRVHLSLGRVALKRGQRVLAKTALERYLKDAPDGESATWARSQVEKLEGL